jgi:ankyrin repeat protein
MIIERKRDMPWGITMHIRSMSLMLLLGVALFTGAASAAETANMSLVDAARQGDRQAVRSLLDDRAKVDVAGADGMTALIWAAHRNDTEMAALLLRAGADVKAANDYGATALYAAAANADPEITAMLLATGADANAPLLSGETPLMEAAERGNLETLRVLLSRGANLNAREANGGQTALMWAISESQSAVTEELVRRGADVHARSNNGFTALMFAAQVGDTDSARVLLSGGANPNDVMPKTGLTPLIIAAAMGRTKVAALLLDKGANPEAVAADGFTPLHHAAKNKEAVEMVGSLLRHGAKPNVRLAQKKPTVAASGIVLQSATPLALAAETNNLDAVKVLVDGGANPFIPTEKNTTPLLLAAGAGTDLARPRSPEERAMALQTVRFLVERGADVNAAGEFGWTALHAAAYQGLNDVIEFLAGHGARLDVKDRFGQTPLSISYAIITRDIGDAYYQTPRVFRRDTADLLLKLGATPLDRSGVVGVVHRPAE